MSSPIDIKGKRKSLVEAFDDLDLAPASTFTAPSSPRKRQMMVQSFRNTISKAWPPQSHQKESMAMTIRADNVYRQYARDQDPHKLFDKAINWISAIQTTSLDAAQGDVIASEIQDAMVRAIFGSNMIERAGLSWDITVQLCRRIFAGEDIGIISERDVSYQHELLELYRQQPGLRDQPAQYVLRGRSEVVQHAKAFQYLVHAFVIEKQDLTEDLIKATHVILTKDVPIVEPGMPDVPPEKYGGIYRTVIVGAGTTNFTVPSFVPAKMKEMCDNIKEDLVNANKHNTVDPFSIAAKYSLEFVSIHPFQDGNGRMCRMILNAILCRYAGIIVPIGEQGEERDEYMGIKKRASQNMEGHGEYATFVLQRAVTRLREMKKKLAGKRGKGSVGSGSN
ncbi:fido domain-containing protein [Dactylonectria estremocensis]|uniref:Fido domain-containing protein n=1 Tax=Dactylonectria estremocensis TaxID=1079267 RepID=A0A9P9DZI6_9HYPO|nr:fido domain-containing protein [Dactylonectria estremocensis]